MSNENYEAPKQTQNADLESEIQRMLETAGEDFSELEAHIEEHEDDYAGDLADYAFREAIRSGSREYVEAHAADFDLNDGDGYSTYLYETDDAKMQELLMDCGAFRSWEDYENCLFAVETVNGEILSFDPDFQKEAYEQYKKQFSLTDAQIMILLGADTEDEEEEPDTDRYVEDDMKALGVSFEAGEPQFMDMISSGGSETKDLLEELGWYCSFEGDSWKLETAGVYFIDTEQEEAK